MKTCERCEHCHTAGAEWCRCPCHPDTSHKCPPYYPHYPDTTTPNIPWTGGPIWTVQHHTACCANGNNSIVRIY